MTGVPAVAPLWRSLRVQLAVVGFLAIYVPVLVLFGVTRVTEDEVVEVVDGVEVASDRTAARPSPWEVGTVVVLGPVAAGLAWWWAGRAVRPIDRVRAVAEDIEGSDLSRRIGLAAGPTEVVALAASFDAMLDRLEGAAEAQRRLVEETSHEVRTPLAVVTASLDVLLDDPGGGPETGDETYREGLERARRAATRLRTTIDDLLVDARGRARTIDRRPADLAAVTRRVVDEARVLATPRKVGLVVAGPPTATCSFDEPTVARAGANLVDNAIRFAPPGTTVEVEVEAPDGSGLATVTVTDHGPGVPADLQHRIFERFWRAHDAPGTDAPGTGLGLPIARQIALAHGGDLTVASPGPEGDGCSFVLSMRCGS